jgi:MarR family transcriptional regulator, organic hydroperoxide resistance regulator
VEARDGNNEEIVRRLMDLFASTLHHQAACLEGVGLTYAQAKLLWRVEPGELLALNELARRIGVDPSNAAGVVDQLTERGLLASRRSEHDRRVRLIRLTGPGVRLRRQLIERMSDHPALESLSPARRDELLDILREVA